MISLVWLQRLLGTLLLLLLLLVGTLVVGGLLAPGTLKERERVEPQEIFCKLGTRSVRKVYRMTEDSFWNLHFFLLPTLQQSKRKRGSTPNGGGSSAARLSMALRWFAGGESG